METSAIISIIIACISLAGTIALAVWDTLYKAKLDARRQQRKVGLEVQRYKDPLLLAAWELQSRLFDVLDTNIPDDGVVDPQGRYNFEVFSSYLLAHFLAWAWILRERTQFLAFSGAPHWLSLREVLYKFEDELDRKYSKGVNYGAQPSDRLLVSERAIVFNEPADDNLPMRPMRWDEFRKAWETEFKAPLGWYTNQIVKNTLEAKMYGNAVKDQRLRRMQHLLVDLIDILDPDKTMTSDRPNRFEKCEKAQWCDCEDDECWKGQPEEAQLCKNRRERHDRAHEILAMRKGQMEEAGKRGFKAPGEEKKVPEVPSTAAAALELKVQEHRGREPDLEKGGHGKGSV